MYVPDVQVGLLVGSVYWAPLELRPSLPDVLSTDMEPDVLLIAHLLVLRSIPGFDVCPRTPSQKIMHKI